MSGINTIPYLLYFLLVWLEALPLGEKVAMAAVGLACVYLVLKVVGKQ